MRRDLGTLGVVNPYAMAEHALGHRVDWKAVADPKRLLEEALGQPRRQLFDSRADSLIYRGLKPAAAGQLRRVGPTQRTSDLTRRLAPARPLAATTPAGGRGQAPSVIIPSAVLTEPPAGVKLGHLSSGQQRHSEAILAGLLALSTQQEASPPGIDWVDVGVYFDAQRRPEVGDPIQGDLADCYLIAALSAVAWARPELIRQRFRQVDGRDVQTVVFHPQGEEPVSVRITERLPVWAPADEDLLYAESADGGELWPAIIEKAFAKWKTGAGGDRPNYLGIEYGDCIAASAELTGLERSYFWNEELRLGEIWQEIRGHSAGGRTVDPMTAFTYASNEAAPTAIDYEAAGIVANHCYTILGWQRIDQDEYVLLRNPWGNHEPTEGTLPERAWRAIVPTSQANRYSPTGGVFGLRLPLFKRYFEGFGLVS